MVDDRTRLAYVELHPDQRGATCAGFLRRAAAWFTDQGCGPIQALMSDNALAYVKSTDFAAALADLGARQIPIPPRTPRWNGKVCVSALLPPPDRAARLTHTFAA